MNRGLHATWSALFAAVSQINGAAGGYSHSFVGRVFPVLVTPEDPAEMPDWWVSIPLLGQVVPTEDDGTTETVHWTIPLFVFAPENAANPLEQKAIETIATVIDDIRRRIAIRPALDGAAHNARVLNWTAEAGVELGQTYGEAVIDVQVTQISGPEDIGPYA